MFVGAILSDSFAASTIGAALMARGAGLDFAALLMAAAAGDPDAMQDGGSATRTESSRSVAMLGSLRKTIISYTDGTSDVQMSAMDVDISATEPGMPWRVAEPVGVAFRADSDLEPEVGADRDQRARMWRMRAEGQGTGTAKAGRGTGAGRVALRACEAGAADDEASEDMRVGRLIDRMV